MMQVFPDCRFCRYSRNTEVLVFITGSIYILASVAYLLMGVETFRTERKQRANLLFFLTCIALALWSFSVAGVMLSESLAQALFFRRIAVLFWSVIYSIYFHFIVVLTRSSEEPTRWSNWSSRITMALKMIIVYTPALFSIYLYFFREPSTAEEMVRTSFGWAYLNLPRNFLWDNYFLLLYLFFILASIIALLFWGRRTRLRRIKYLVRVIVGSTIIALAVGTITDFLLPLTTGNLFPPLGVLVSMIPIIGVRFASVRYRMLQLNPFGTAREILQNMQEGLMLITLNNRIVNANREAERLLLYGQDELDGLQYCDLFPEGCMEGIISINGSREGRLLRKDGSTLPVMLTIETLRDRWEDPIGTLMLFQDLTDLKNIQSELEASRDLLKQRVKERTSRLSAINQDLENEIVNRIQMENKIRSFAYNDQLTGLANRKLFTDRLEQAIFDAEKSQTNLAVFFLNLDAFKVVNDTFGHLLGDSLLSEIARRLKGFFGETKTIARSGSDHFLLLSRFTGNAELLYHEVNEIRSIFKEPFVLNGRDLLLTTTLGISIYPGDGEHAAELIKNAELAMFEAKSAGHNTFEFFTSELNAAITEEMEISNDLYLALERDEFELYYQPQVNPLREQIAGVEALIRWNHPVRGLLSPDKFIGIAEKSNLILRIGEWVLREACMQLRKWHDAGHTDLLMAVNLSINQLTNGGLEGIIRQVIDEAGIHPASLEIELTESILITKTETAIRDLSKIREMGVQIAIDDFGTVYSSLSYLRKLPLDRMKIAREFVMGIGKHTVDEAIISAIIVMGRSMDLEIIAEGVEYQEQLEFLKARSCDIIQGFYYSRPVPSEALTAMLESGQPR